MKSQDDRSLLKQNNLIRFLQKYASAIIWFLVLTILLTLPGSAFPETSWLDKIHFDKIVHVGLFFTWGILFNIHGILKKKINLKQALGFAIATIVYGIIMEFIQKNFIPNRGFDTGDMIANAVGAITAFFTVRYLKRRNRTGH
ncbi:VanZ family protein [Polluticaenibacter yanchengensis]|uniref:VanZ family protein n=1 Tax=Polluticaenibacter yanchengensis TaxID=3014562 RepID=A0ABT4UI42_9BACT|nr:VanZ family protein [Chitinophagaceae bacterium LY-5]